MKQPSTSPIKVTTSSITFLKKATHHHSKEMCSTPQAKKNTRWLVKKPERSDIWTSTNYTEERQRIREFWLQLPEEERRSLVKVEKEAVLRKMKERQRQNCDCTVCGKKRTAIEDELEVLYDAYYEELEQYVYRQQQNGMYSSDSHTDDEDEDEDEDEEEDEDDDDEDDDVEDEEEEEEVAMDEGEEDDDQVESNYRNDGPVAESNSAESHRQRSARSEPQLSKTLTVKGSIMTVADELLRNDGKRFLDMLEKLAERKMLKEQEVIESNSLFGEDEDEEGEDDEDEDDEDDDEEDEDESDQDPRTEEQRIEEGRKMFQVFAARMFEQRVLTAYREKVAQDRQRRLIEELEEEDRQRQERELKKQQDKQKKRDRKRQLKLQQEKERLEQEEKKKKEEEAARILREQKLEQERQIKEQERLKREQEKRQKEEERRKRRLKEEKAKAAEKEKKRKEEEESRRKRQQLEEEKLNRERKRKTNNNTSPANNNNNNTNKITEHQHRHQHHHILTDANTADVVPAERRTSLAGPIGSPVRPKSVYTTNACYVTSDTENHNSLFSNFLFGTVKDCKQFDSNRRSSLGETASSKWTNGWTPLTTLSDNVHGKLFGDILFKNKLILERARLAYLELNRLAQIKQPIIPNYHTLLQLHHVMHEMPFDTVSIDIRELFETITQPSSGFQCMQHQHQGYIVRMESALLPNLPPPPPLPIAPLAPSAMMFDNLMS